MNARNKPDAIELAFLPQKTPKPVAPKTVTAI